MNDNVNHQLQGPKVFNITQVDSDQDPERRAPQGFDQSDEMRPNHGCLVPEVKREDDVTHAVSDVEEDGIHPRLVKG